MTVTMKERIESSNAAYCVAEAFYSNETVGKIQVGIDSFRRGECRPVEDVFAELHKKHGL